MGQGRVELTAMCLYCASTEELASLQLGSLVAYRLHVPTSRHDI